MSDGYRRVSDILDDMASHGVYDVAMLTEQSFVLLGYSYDAVTDELSWGGRTVRLGSRDRYAIQNEMDRDPKGGVLIDTDPRPGEQLVDALSVSIAIHKLVLPDKRLPSSLYNGRGKGYQKNIESIRGWEHALQGGLQ